MTFRFLASYHYHRATDLAGIAASYGSGGAQVFADSGAFSAYTKGTAISLTDYAAWLTRWKDLFAVAANLDVIGDPAATRRNQGRLEDLGHAVLPVFHAGSPWAELERLCARYDYVALGGMVPHRMDRRAVMRWLVRCFRIAADHGTRLHGFGQTNAEVIAELPFYSVDSSTWARLRYGEIHLWDARACRIRRVSLADRSQIYARAALLRAHHADPATFAQPGFGLKSGKTYARYRAERAALAGVCACAWHRFGQWLAVRHAVPPPAGHTPVGTCLYLADTSPDLAVIGPALARADADASARR